MRGVERQVGNCGNKSAESVAIYLFNPSMGIALNDTVSIVPCRLTGCLVMYAVMEMFGVSTTGDGRGYRSLSQNRFQPLYSSKTLATHL